MAGAASQPSNSGIITDSTSGERHIPESLRADGSTRKAIKIRPGYRPPEDVEVYKNRTAETFRSRAQGPIPGAEAAIDDSASTPTSAAANKNAKRREARKKAKAAAGNHEQDETARTQAEPEPEMERAREKRDPPIPGAEKATEDGEAEREKKARNLRKKLKQARELKEKKEGGEALLPEQIAKVIKINELIRELEALGLDHDP